MKRVEIFSISFLAFVAITGPALSKNIDYVVTEQRLDKVIEDLTIVAGVTIIFNETSNLTVRNWRAQGAPSKVISDLSARLGLHYNFDGSSYELSMQRSLTSVAFPIGPRTRSSVMKTIRTAFPSYSAGSVRWSTSGPQEVLLLRGSKRFTETVEAVLKACEPACSDVKLFLGGRLAN